MKTFEAEYRSLFQRFFNIINVIYLEYFILFASCIFILKPAKPYLIIFGILLFIIFIVLVINNNKTNIHRITFHENTIELQGVTFNEEWKKSISIKGTKIFLKSKSSKQGICGATFYIQLKNTNKKFSLNRFQTFSDQEIIEIFNEFKNRKEEKIIIDKKLIVNRIKEKIEKCQ
ncbi:hypothetical protein [Flavobacterium marginilacus]|uniref:hypothetical protein n=1 Tax=Flavobacterium marginilacus TaxID=3003256 RepID=UPI00248EE9E3|nr:hypothetical protein [Flavobacterium marginilacus]